ncbi:hypothetical protein Plhal304r1_c003g0011671 [Plasmopara halstedii]
MPIRLHTLSEHLLKNSELGVLQHNFASSWILDYYWAKRRGRGINQTRQRQKEMYPTVNVVSSVAVICGMHTQLFG